MKMAFNVGAVLRRGDFSDTEKPTIDSRSESIVATPAIFIGGGAPQWRMENSYENAGLGSHADRAVCGKRGPVNP
jgi:hypothetical protein